MQAGVSSLTSYDFAKTAAPDSTLPEGAKHLAAELDAIRACDFSIDWSLDDYDGALPNVVTAKLEEITLATDRGMRPAEELAEHLLDVLARLVQQDGVEFAPEIVEQISELHRLACLASA